MTRVSTNGKKLLIRLLLNPNWSLENDKKLFLMTDWGFGDWHQLRVQFVAKAVSVVYNVSVTYITPIRDKIAISCI